MVALLSRDCEMGRERGTVGDVPLRWSWPDRGKDGSPSWGTLFAPYSGLPLLV